MAAELIAGEAEDILRRVRPRLVDPRLHELAGRALDELVRSLRHAKHSPPGFPPIGVEALVGMLRELSAQVLDAIESRVSA